MALPLQNSARVGSAFPPFNLWAILRVLVINCGGTPPNKRNRHATKSISVTFRLVTEEIGEKTSRRKLVNLRRVEVYFLLLTIFVARIVIWE